MSSTGFDMSVRKWTNQRLMDLVRYQRHDLHDAGLTTEGEFAFLVNEGSSAARRLEDYDAMRAEVERLRGLLGEAERQCVWSTDDSGPWDTECGHMFECIDGGPDDNGFKFCCYCGGALASVAFDAEEKEACGE